MVKLLPPPPTKLPAPVVFTMPKRQVLYRIFDPSKFDARASDFRDFGPISRFDHHRARFNEPEADTERSVMYAGFSVTCCLVEVFGDCKRIETGNYEVGKILTLESMRLLDLRKDGAMRAGSVAALTKDGRFCISQQWSKFFYENKFLYGEIDGLIYGNAHNDEDSVVFYERAKNKSKCESLGGLNSKKFEDTIDAAAADFGLDIECF